MSRIGRMPVPVPPGVQVKIEGNRVTVAGPKGELSRDFSPEMSVRLEDNVLTVSRPSDSKSHRSLHGLTRTLLANMVQGVTALHERSLDIVGVGYRAEKTGEKLVLRVGFSHTVEITPPPGVSLIAETATRIKVSGASKEAVGQMAAEIRAVRPPDAYKGKGIRYVNEPVHLKPGKAGKAIGKS